MCVRSGVHVRVCSQLCVRVVLSELYAVAVGVVDDDAVDYTIMSAHRSCSCDPPSHAAVVSEYSTAIAAVAVAVAVASAVDVALAAQANH